MVYNERRRSSPALFAGIVAGLGGAAAIVGAVLPWISTTGEGGRIGISGLGSITGSQLGGSNLNDLIAIGGVGSYRPGLVGLVAGIITVLLGIGIVLAAAGGVRGSRPWRWVSLPLLLLGVLTAGWGLWRTFAPGTAAGVLAAGDAAAGAGPVVSAIGGVLMLVAGGWLLSGRADPAPVTRRSAGIQR
ncbi:hypothetical protein [Nakamurella aerolata]|uniref:Uncharacterized protein n=1 Tax=Nakamurella aerolata TaxID=1656892 RepID=A0A849A4Z7_9ACTN|nr:hypothetical protein [Nakamurella aerolata]NNG34706.1 hypothetical protein [Nakamurella aerolata]